MKGVHEGFSFRVFTAPYPSAMLLARCRAWFLWK
jgi:hypothetical protein